MLGPRPPSLPGRTGPARRTSLTGPSPRPASPATDRRRSGPPEICSHPEWDRPGRPGTRRGPSPPEAQQPEALSHPARAQSGLWQLHGMAYGRLDPHRVRSISDSCHPIATGRCAESPHVPELFDPGRRLAVDRRLGFAVSGRAEDGPRRFADLKREHEQAYATIQQRRERARTDAEAKPCRRSSGRRSRRPLAGPLRGGGAPEDPESVERSPGRFMESPTATLPSMTPRQRGPSSC